MKTKLKIVSQKVSAVLLCSLFTLSNSLQAEDNLQRLLDMSLEELLNIDVRVASNVMSDARKQPVSMTSISRSQITHSGARTLNELLMIYIPGYFKVEDQDDVIAAFRGFAPDNNSKVLFLLNGQAMNTEWFWGSPDSILNGLNMDFIERIEVIRGPGSVTLGQGALLGVINVVTRQSSGSWAQLDGGAGQDGYRHAAYQLSTEKDDFQAYAYIATGKYDGQSIRNEGWAADRVENDTTVYQRGHKLYRGDYENFIGNVRFQDVEINLAHIRQQRDLYNFYRDREEVEQTLTSVNISYVKAFTADVRVRAKARFEQDDYALGSHRGVVMGGSRELRDGVSVLMNINNFFNNSMALGAEVNRYRSGRANSSGNTFIANNETDRLANINGNSRWAYASETLIYSVFAENFFKLNDKVDLFAAFRYDHHPDWGGHISPRLGALFAASDTLMFRATWQTGFRDAVGVHYSGGYERDGLLREDNFSQIEDNPILGPLGFDNLSPTKPETISNIEFAANWQPKPNLRLEGVVFHNTLENIIDVGVIWLNPNEHQLAESYVGTDIAGDWNGFWFFKNNEGQIRSWGAELSANYQWDEVLFGASYSSVRVLSASDDQFGGSMYIAGTRNNEHFKAYPEDVLRFHMTWQFTDELTLGYNHLYYRQWLSPANNVVKGNHLGYVALGWQPTKQLSMRLNLTNLFNAKKLYPLNNNAGEQDLSDGAPTLEERTWWVNMSYRF